MMRTLTKLILALAVLTAWGCAVHPHTETTGQYLGGVMALNQSAQAALKSKDIAAAQANLDAQANEITKSEKSAAADAKTIADQQAQLNAPIMASLWWAMPAGLALLALAAFTAFKVDPLSALPFAAAGGVMVAVPLVLPAIALACKIAVIAALSLGAFMVIRRYTTIFDKYVKTGKALNDIQDPSTAAPMLSSGTKPLKMETLATLAAVQADPVVTEAKGA